MIKTRIVKFVGHIHNMQLRMEIISFINDENESLLRWFYSFVTQGISSGSFVLLQGVFRRAGARDWFMTYCCCLVEFGSSCFNHALIESWFVWFGPWYTTILRTMWYFSFSFLINLQKCQQFCVFLSIWGAVCTLMRTKNELKWF